MQSLGYDTVLTGRVRPSTPSTPTVWAARLLPASCRRRSSRRPTRARSGASLCRRCSRCGRSKLDGLADRRAAAVPRWTPTRGSGPTRSSDPGQSATRCRSSPTPAPATCSPTRRCRPRYDADAAELLWSRVEGSCARSTRTDVQELLARHLGAGRVVCRPRPDLTTAVERTGAHQGAVLAPPAPRAVQARRPSSALGSGPPSGNRSRATPFVSGTMRTSAGARRDETSSRRSSAAARSTRT